MDQPREDREQILTLQTDVQQLRYLISLVDLLATCAEASHSHRLSDSVCLSVCLSVCYQHQSLFRHPAVWSNDVHVSTSFAYVL